MQVSLGDALSAVLPEMYLTISTLWAQTYSSYRIIKNLFNVRTLTATIMNLVHWPQSSIWKSSMLDTPNNTAGVRLYQLLFSFSAFLWYLEGRFPSCDNAKLTHVKIYVHGIRLAILLPGYVNLIMPIIYHTRININLFSNSWNLRI